MNDLELVDSEDLIKELAGRHDAIVILGMNFMDQTHTSMTVRFQGPRHMLIGLTSDAHHNFLRMTDQVPPEGEEWSGEKCDHD